MSDLKVVCAWCEQTPPGAVVSQGICPACEVRLLAAEVPPVEPFEPRGGTYYGQGEY